MSTELQAIQSPSSDPMLALVERAARDQTIDVEKMEKLLAMAERLHARKAESEYDAAMNAAQAEMRPVANDSDNPQTRSRYASYGALDRAVRPIYTEHGFSLSFGTRSPVADRVTVTCRISHRAGHTERVEIDMPSDGKGAKGGDVMTKTHATGSAVSYGMRYLLKMIFNIAVGEYDDDGNAAGKAPKSAYRQPEPQRNTTPSPKERVANPTAAKKDDEKQWASFLASCKARLLELVGDGTEWAWWQYGTLKDWILPTETLADARPEKMFEGFDRNNAKESIKAIFEKHQTAVTAMAANCAPDMREEILRGMVPMPRKTAKEPEKPKPNPRACPSCSSTAIKTHDDLVGVTWCQKCGTQWQDENPNEDYEEHPWMFAKLPFAPKDPTKKYKGKTLGQLSRLDSKYWFGIVSNFKAEPFKGRPPSEESVKFGEACELARKYLNEGIPNERGGAGGIGENDGPPDDDPEIPF